MQVNQFLGDFASDAPTDAMYVVFIGGNDVRDAFVAVMTAGGGLAGVLDGLEAIPGIYITRKDVFGLTNEAVADPAVFDLSNVTDA